MRSAYHKIANSELANQNAESFVAKGTVFSGLSIYFDESNNESYFFYATRIYLYWGKPQSKLDEVCL